MTGRNPQPRHRGRNKAGQMDKWLATFAPRPMNAFAYKQVPKDYQGQRIGQSRQGTGTRQATPEEVRDAAQRTNPRSGYGDL